MAGKKYQESLKNVDIEKLYKLEDAVDLVKKCVYAKFNESVDMALRLGVDPKHSDQMVRGSVVLPHGSGKKVRIAVFAKGEKEKEAKDAGADYIGSEDLAEKISKGWMDFDSVISTPDLMGMVGKLGKILGPRGLMPNPKTGTVTFDLAKIIKEIRQGRADFKVDKAGIVHVPVGKASFDGKQLLDNMNVILESIIKAKPASSKGRYLKSITLSSTMGPGVKVDPILVANMFA